VTDGDFMASNVKQNDNSLQCSMNYGKFGVKDSVNDDMTQRTRSLVTVNSRHLKTHYFISAHLAP